MFAAQLPCFGFFLLFCLSSFCWLLQFNMISLFSSSSLRPLSRSTYSSVLSTLSCFFSSAYFSFLFASSCFLHNFASISDGSISFIPPRFSACSSCSSRLFLQKNKHSLGLGAFRTPSCSLPTGPTSFLPSLGPNVDVTSCV